MSLSRLLCRLRGYHRLRTLYLKTKPKPGDFYPGPMICRTCGRNVSGEARVKVRYVLEEPQEASAP